MSKLEQATYIILLIYLVIGLCQGTLDFRNWHFNQPNSSDLNLNAHGQTGIHASSSGGGSSSSGSTSSNVEMVKLYDSPNSTQEIQALDWETCYVGESKTKTIYIKNVDTKSITMTFTTSNWVPVETSNYLKLDWNYRNETIIPTQIVPVDFVLWIASNITGITNFSFQITIWTTEVNE